MPLSAACVVIVHECTCLGGPPAQQPRRLALLINQSPVLAVLDGFLKDTLGHEVERSGHTLGCLDPVHQDLAGPVLVVLQAIVPPVEVGPVLANIELALHAGGFDVLCHVLASKALRKIETPAGVPNLTLQPGHPVDQRCAHLLVGVIQVWGCVVVLPTVGGATATELGVIVRDSPLAPRQALAWVLDVIPEHVPDAILILLVGAAVVDHDVSDGANAGILQCCIELLKLLLVAELAVQVVQLPWQVALRGYGLGRGR
mmetsp:Transcript_17941/g.53988  ORF Transcript_17941/g.53988 Transcript_17941/m.53988 type:complete len:258 (-) Transcript_17941:481-1254(-)